MRLFVAVDLDAHVRRAVGDVIVRAREAVDRAAPGAARAIKWVDPGNLHLTLHFLGEIEDARVEALRERLSEEVGEAPFALGLGGAGCFPEAGPPRVVWIGVTTGAEPMARLHASIGGRLRELRIEVDERPFHPHLTIGRVKGAVRPGVRTAIGRIPCDTVGECRVAEATLYRSVLGRPGPAYTALAKTALGGT